MSGLREILDVPFGYTIAGILSLYLVSAKEFASYERLGFVALIGSLITSFVAAYRPIDRHYLPSVLEKAFGKSNILYSIRDVNESSPVSGMEINFLCYAYRALKSTPLEGPRTRIRSIFYLVSILLILCFVFGIFPPALLAENLNPETRILSSMLSLLASIVLVLPLVQEIQDLPRQLYLEGLYLLGTENTIDMSANFAELRESLGKNDWSAAESWVERWFLEGKFFPRWPREVSLTVRELKGLTEDVFYLKETKGKK